MMKILKLIIVLSLLPGLCSCTSYGTSFERCKGSDGQKCTSVSKVNRLIDLGLIRDDEYLPEEQTQTKKPKASKRKSKPKQKKEFEVWMPGQTDKEEKFI